MPTTSLYADRIRDLVPDLDPRHVEAYMRGDYGTLDHLSPPAFDNAARSCAETVRLDPAFAEEVAVSYGL